MAQPVGGFRQGGVLEPYGDYQIFGQWLFSVPPIDLYLAVGAVSTYALNGHTAGSYMLNRAGVTAVTVGAPTSGTDDFNVLQFLSDSAFAHTITFTGGTLDTGSAAVTSATFNPFKGASLAVTSFNGRWKVTYANGVAFS